MSCEQSFYPSSLKDKELTVAMLQLHDTVVVDVLTQNGHCHGFILLHLLHLAVPGIFPTVVLLNLEHPGLTLLITFIGVVSGSFCALLYSQGSIFSLINFWTSL
jgi:hypothetical protein